jgi:organic hydroperoxide reductase OsmC/OhrA
MLKKGMGGLEGRHQGRRRHHQRRPRDYREHPTVSARIPGTDNAKFQEIANKAKTGCPVSKLLKAQITMDAN